MKQFLKALPLPAAGVTLGLAALGNLLQSYSEGVRLVLGALALAMWVCLVLKPPDEPGSVFMDCLKP